MKYIKTQLILFLSYLFLLHNISHAQELTPEQIFEEVNDCVVVILSYDFNGNLSKQGSGVIINDKGWVVTNYHVFAECERMEIKHKEILVNYSNIIAANVEDDILILKIENNKFKSIKIGDSDNLKVGQRVYAVGSPLGLENSLSEGIISGLRNVYEKNKNYIQITASISPGSSGGAVVNSNGELIGISTMTLIGGQNLNFAIPINDIFNIQISKENDNIDITGNNLFYKGYNALDAEDYNEALECFNKYLKLFPDDYGAYANRGLAYAGLKLYEQAISNYNISIKLSPNHTDVYYNRGIAYKSIKEYSKAIKDFDVYIENNPEDDAAYYVRGLCKYEIKNKTGAYNDYYKVIELNAPEYPFLCLELANKEYYDGNYTKSIENAYLTIQYIDKDRYKKKCGTAYYFSALSKWKLGYYDDARYDWYLSKQYGNDRTMTLDEYMK